MAIREGMLKVRFRSSQPNIWMSRMTAPTSRANIVTTVQIFVFCNMALDQGRKDRVEPGEICAYLANQSLPAAFDQCSY